MEARGQGSRWGARPAQEHVRADVALSAARARQIVCAYIRGGTSLTPRSLAQDETIGRNDETTSRCRLTGVRYGGEKMAREGRAAHAPSHQLAAGAQRTDERAVWDGKRNKG
eukprot:3085562-Pleurochrysis_carterae.AAC.1